MATEDITVRHSVSAETASFDTLNRVLTLPVWQDMDNALYDMLVGHEVSHALHTPADGWKTAVGEGPLSRMRHMFVNVVEDARIERLIKAQFPGLRRDFASAYTSLHDRDLFEVKGKDLTDLPLIDRLNLEFKLGLFGLISVPFSTGEQQYVTRMAETKTFEEVVALAHELFDIESEKMNDDQQQDQMSEAGEGEESDSDIDMPSESDEDGQSDDQSGVGAGTDSDEDGEEGTSAAGGSEGDEDGTDSGQSMTDDTDDGESADSTDGEGSGTGREGDLSYDDYSNNPAAPGSTQNAFENGVSEMRDTEADEYAYLTLPTANLDQIVVDHTIIAGMFSDIDTTASEKCSKQYLNSIKPIVNSMVQQFQMKQAADADKRTSVSKTGILNPVSMINYRWSEDIFLKNETVSDGKNHGIVMYLDWSGSMCNILQDTVEQLLVLVEFCRKVNIPFEVYAFSSNLYCPYDRYSDENKKWHDDQPDQWNTDDDSDCHPHSFQLYNFLSSRMNKQQYASGVQNLWMTVAGITDYSVPYPRHLSLGSTPLNEAVVCAMQQVPEFQNAHGVQIVSTVFLTDGEGHGMMGGSWGRQLHVTDKKTKKSYRIEGRGETKALLEMLRDRTGSNLVGIRLHDAKNIKHLRWDLPENEYEALSKQYKNENYITLDSAYDEYFIVKGDLKVETDAMESLTEDASYTRIKNAFIKGGNRKKTSRVIANKMVDIFAS